MHSKIALVMAALVGAPACGVAEEPVEADRGTAGDVEEPDDSEAPARIVRVALDQEPTVENVIPQILAGGRAELGAACADRPEESIRIVNPIEPGAFEDVPCSSLLCDVPADEEAISVPVPANGDEQIGMVQQPWSPFGLACSVITTGSALVANYALCPRATNPRDRRNCDRLTTGGFTGLGFLCVFI